MTDTHSTADDRPPDLDRLAEIERAIQRVHDRLDKLDPIAAGVAACLEQLAHATEILTRLAPLAAQFADSPIGRLVGRKLKGGTDAGS